MANSGRPFGDEYTSCVRIIRVTNPFFFSHCATVCGSGNRMFGSWDTLPAGQCRVRYTIRIGYTWLCFLDSLGLGKSQKSNSHREQFL